MHFLVQTTSVWLRFLCNALIYFFLLVRQPEFSRLMKSKLWRHWLPALNGLEKGTNKTCPVRRWKSNANVCRKPVLKLSVKPDSPCGCSPPSGRSLPEMNTATFLERTLSVRAMATGLRHPSGLRQSNLNSNNSMKFSDKLSTSRHMGNCYPHFIFSSLHAQNFDAPDSRPGSGTRLSPLEHVRLRPSTGS